MLLMKTLAIQVAQARRSDSRNVAGIRNKGIMAYGINVWGIHARTAINLASGRLQRRNASGRKMPAA